MSVNGLVWARNGTTLDYLWWLNQLVLARYSWSVNGRAVPTAGDVEFKGQIAIARYANKNGSVNLRLEPYPWLVQ